MADFPQTTMSDNSVRIDFANTYARLPERFFARLDPTPVSSPRLIRLNNWLVDNLGIDPNHLGTVEGVQILSGN